MEEGWLRQGLIVKSDVPNKNFLAPSLPPSLIFFLCFVFAYVPSMGVGCSVQTHLEARGLCVGCLSLLLSSLF